MTVSPCLTASVGFLIFVIFYGIYAVIRERRADAQEQCRAEKAASES
jgi:hypothetical protein